MTDITGTLSTSEQQSLTQQLQDITHKTRAQVAVLVVPSTGDDSIEQYATRVFDSWKLGDKQRNDGILLLVAWEDHAVRIEVGYGLEGVVTDLQAAKIIRDILIPAFKSDDLMGGLTLASENIGALLLNGELPEDRGIITVSIPYSIIACCNYIAGGTFIFYCFYRSVEFTLDHSHWRHLRDGIPLCCRARTMDQFNRCLRYVNAFCDRTTGYFWLIVNKATRQIQKLSKERASRKGSSSSSSGGGSSGGGSGGGFSGGGGSSGGGGASGRW